jgi:hypothetical protein
VSGGGNPDSRPLLSRREWLAGVALAGSTIRAAFAAPVRLLPAVNEGSKDPQLQRFLTGLKTIVAKHHSTALLALMDPVFRVDFGGGKGPTAFVKQWHPADPDSPVWKILERLLELGGTFYTPTLFAMSYVYTKFPFDLDPFAFVVVTRDQAPVRPEPNPDAAPFTTLQPSIVPVKPNLTAPVRLDQMSWLKVQVPDGQEGYVATADVYSPAGYRAFFEKRGGKWRWISLACAE